MRASLIVLPLCLFLASCGSDSLVGHQERNIMSSLPYDSTPCNTLLAKRQSLMSRYYLDENAKPVVSATPLGLGPVVPDTRSKAQQAVEQARGEIDAMNRSMVRRKCIPASPKA
ncbi:hypothetical protein [Mesorhizobium sp. 8]|uniref:hypothetical protein n=1 Tax=Mesorhizobium sp. 8 TaxID=2584466 RepID=UPI00111D2925|nr:hypothetical protein [Mesorhizobium sp. 8]QDC02590.1 hypothetical protein FGU64_20340 [Mesorhizobium sp. 8]